MITDRTQADVDAAKALLYKMEQEGYKPTTAEQGIINRGSYTATALNRVRNKQAVLSNSLRKYRYMVSLVNSSVWQTSKIFGYNDHKEYLKNLDRLKQAFFVYPSTPSTPTYLYHYIAANAVEQILVDIEAIQTDMAGRFRQCGTFQCGERNEL